MRASCREIKEQIAYLKILIRQIEVANNKVNESDYSSRTRGTVVNLCPEISKAASELKRMNKYGWK